MQEALQRLFYKQNVPLPIEDKGAIRGGTHIRRLRQDVGAIRQERVVQGAAPL